VSEVSDDAILSLHNTITSIINNLLSSTPLSPYLKALSKASIHSILIKTLRIILFSNGKCN
jgi:hypothetical protein